MVVFSIGLFLFSCAEKPEDLTKKVEQLTKENAELQKKVAAITKENAELGRIRLCITYWRCRMVLCP
jgi:hypothetical protein